MIPDTRVLSIEHNGYYNVIQYSASFRWTGLSLSWRNGLSISTLVLFILYFLYLRHAHTQCAARSHSRFMFELTIRVLSSSLLNLFHCTIDCVTVRITVKNYHFPSKDWSISNSMQHLVLQFRFNFRWFLCVKYLSKCHRFVYNYKIHIFTWNAPKTTGFLFIHINLHPVLNIVIDSVLVSSFDLWFRISEYRYIFRLDRGGRYIKGVARFAWAKLALAG